MSKYAIIKKQKNLIFLFSSSISIEIVEFHG